MIKDYDLEALRVAVDAAQAATMRAAGHDWPAAYYLVFKSLAESLADASAFFAARQKLTLDNIKQQGAPAEGSFSVTSER